jgi:hypothetical protein
VRHPRQEDPRPQFWRVKVKTPKGRKTLHVLARDAAEADRFLAAWCKLHPQRHRVMGQVQPLVPTRDVRTSKGLRGAHVLKRKKVSPSPARLWTYDLLLGPALEEDSVGRIVINPMLALEAVTRLSDTRYDRQQHRTVRVILTDAFARTFRAIVRWQSESQAIATPQEFVRWLTLRPWDVDVLAVPAVQDWIDRIRRSRNTDLRRKLGRWMERAGAVSGGPVPQVDVEQVLAAVTVATRQLKRLWKIFGVEERRAATKRDEWHDERSADERRVKARADAWQIARQRCRRIVTRLERAGVANDRRRDTRARPWPFKQLACELVSAETGFGVAHIKRLTRKQNLTPTS